MPNMRNALRRHLVRLHADDDRDRHFWLDIADASMGLKRQPIAARAWPSRSLQRSVAARSIPFTVHSDLCAPLPLPRDYWPPPTRDVMAMNADNHVASITAHAFADIRINCENSTASYPTVSGTLRIRPRPTAALKTSQREFAAAAGGASLRTRPRPQLSRQPHGLAGHFDYPERVFFSLNSRWMSEVATNVWIRDAPHLRVLQRRVSRPPQPCDTKQRR